jgi:hypothetical protein
MFDTITRRPGDIAARHLTTTAVSVVAHLITLAVIVVASVWSFAPSQPTPAEIMAFVAPPAAPPPPPPGRTREARHDPMKATRTPSTPRVVAPVEAPSRIETEKPVDRAAAIRARFVRRSRAALPRSLPRNIFRDEPSGSSRF